MLLEVDPETAGGAGREFAVIVDSPAVFLVDDRVGPGGALGVQLRAGKGTQMIWWVL